MPSVGARARRAAPPASASATVTADLPPYESLSCALSDEAKRALAGLSNSRENTRRYEDHLAKSRLHLGKAIAAVNDRLVERQKELENLARSRAEKNKEKSQREQNLESWLPKLDSEVATLSEKSERAMRDLVDRLAQLEDDKEATAAMTAYFDHQPGRQRPPRRRTQEADGAEVAQEPEGGPEEAPPPDLDPWSVLEQHRAAKAAEYEAMDLHRRYGLNNDYIGFRRLWHDAKFGDEGVPLPNASDWFDENGDAVQPKPKRRRGAAGAHKVEDEDAEGAEDEDEDEDLVIEGEHQSFVCPLSMQQITEPFSNHKCRHTFQKQSIVEWLSEPGYRRQARQCPTPGCTQHFTLKDFYFDDLVLRKIERARKRQAQEEAEEDQRARGAQEEDEDEEMAPTSGAKRERKPRVVDDIEDDE